jgi:hypothetical protein
LDIFVLEKSFFSSFQLDIKGLFEILKKLLYKLTDIVKNGLLQVICEGTPIIDLKVYQ